MHKVILLLVCLAFLAGCASKEPKYIAIFPTVSECPKPERPNLKVLPSGHVGSKQVLSVIMENFNLMELYSSQLENSLECYDKQIDATRKSVEEYNSKQES